MMEEAVRNGDVALVQEFIRSGSDVNKPCGLRHEGLSLLIQAIVNGYKDIALALLEAGADVHAKDSNGWTALHWACAMGRKEVVEALINRGSRVNDEGCFEGRAPLILAEEKGRKAISMCLLRAGASCKELSQGQMDGLFRHACHEGDLLALLTLLKNGCSVRKQTEEDLLYLVHNLSKQEIEELLHCACHEGSVFAVRILLKNGCSVRILSREEQEELFHHACREYDVFVVNALLTVGCSVRKLTEEDLLYLVHNLSKQEIEELLHCACREGSVFAVRTILKNGCSVSILSREEQEELFHHACRVNDVFVVHALLSLLSREKQEELFHNACHEDDVLVVHALLTVGCSTRKLTEKDLQYLVHNLSKQEIEELLHCACRDGSVFAVRILLKNGCSVRILSREEQEELFHHACREDDVFVVHALLTVGCSVRKLTEEDLLYLVHNLSKQEIEELLHCACREGSVFAVRTLLNNGCSVSILSREEQEELFHHACRVNDVFVVHALLSLLSREEQEELFHHACHEDDVLVVHALLTVGCSVRKLTHKDLLYLVNNFSKEEVEELFCCACHEGDVFVACTLLQNGCSIKILSAEEQEQLLHLACLESNVFGVRTLLRNGCSIRKLTQEDLLYMVRDLFKQEVKELLCRAWREGCFFVVCTLVKSGCSVSILSREEQEQLLHHACCESDVLVVEALLASGCNMNCVYSTGYTPLMVATEKGHEEVVKKLILAGVNLEMQTANGDTAFHLAASGNKIQCGILLAEGGASVKIKNKSSQTPLDLGKAEFKEAIKQALSFTTRKALCIIGNAESGKSTLIAALQVESNSFLRKIFNRFRRVSDRRQRTAGIETVPHCSQRYGEVIFFDFAGQDDYHGPHEMFLESLLSKLGVSITLLLVVKSTEEEEAILHQLHRWLSPVALMATTASAPQVIIIGSFLDKVKSKQEATAKLTRCIEATRKDLEELSLEFVGTCFLNCRQPQSEGIDQLCCFLQEIPIPESRATHTHYSLAWVLSQIRLSFTAQAVQLQEFATWVQDNKDNLPRTMPPPEKVCQDLSAAGHALYFPTKKDPLKSWLVLDLPSILHDVYGTLFSQSKEIVNKFGLLHCHHLAKLFPHLDLEMVQQLLVSLEFCLPVDPSILNVDLSKLTHSKKASGWLFFPALITAKPPQPSSETSPEHYVCYLCWQLRTSKKHSISAHVLQAILLRLAAHFVVKQQDEEGLQRHCCSIWWNGIAWQSRKGIDITVHITNNRVIQVIGASVVSAVESCQYLTDVISDILSTVHQFSPKLAAVAYIVHPPKMATSSEDVTAPPPKELFPVQGIQSSLRDHEVYALSLKDSNNDRSTRAVVAHLFEGCTPSLEDIGRISWPPPEPNQRQSPTGRGQPDVLSLTVYCEFMHVVNHAHSKFHAILFTIRPLYMHFVFQAILSTLSLYIQCFLLISHGFQNIMHVTFSIGH